MEQGTQNIIIIRFGDHIRTLGPSLFILLHSFMQLYTCTSASFTQFMARNLICGLVSISWYASTESTRLKKKVQLSGQVHVN